MSEIIVPGRQQLEDTPINRAAIMLLQEWNKQESAGNYKIHRLRKYVYLLARAMREGNEPSLIHKPEVA